MVEAQAAARIDRLDQTKNIVIVRYVVEDSIEQVCDANIIRLICDRKADVLVFRG